MKLYPFFLLLFTFFAPMQASEEDPQIIETEAIAASNQKSDLKNSPPSIEDDKKNAPSEPTDDQNPSEMKKATESYETAFIKTIVVLVALLVLLILTIWMFKKISHGRLRSFNYMKSVKILEKRPLSPKSMLYLLEVGGKQVLIAESQLHVKQITSLDWLSNDKDL